MREQISLLTDSYSPANPAPELASDAERIAGSRKFVEEIMRDGQWRSVPGLVQELRKRFGGKYAETAISARVRDLRKRGYAVERQRLFPSSGLYLYRAVKLGAILLIVARFMHADLAAHQLLVTVARPFAARAIDEAKLDALLRRDVIDASKNIVDWPTRQKISELCARLEREQ